MMLESIFFVGHFGVKLQCRLGLKRLDPKSTETFDFQALAADLCNLHTEV